ncbi:MAG: hypothetical protein IJI14_02600, partial [Anaerolineaceae bacterium]|nr:hypothetical protein [Anaerolineaceae bacterium]
MTYMRQTGIINVNVKKVTDKSAFLTIRPLNETVKDTIKYFDGTRKYHADDHAWEVDLNKVNSLNNALKSLLAKHGIVASISNINEIAEYLAAAEEIRKMNEPTFYDYAENPALYDSAAQLNPAADEDLPVSAPVETVPVRELPKPCLMDYLSEEKCAFSHICRECDGKCPVFMSVRSSFAVERCKDQLREVEKKNEIILNVIYKGKNSFAEAEGFFSENEIFTVKKGSRISENVTEKSNKNIVEKRNYLKKKFIGKDNRFVVDYQFSSVGEATAVVTGGTTDWKEFWEPQLKKANAEKSVFTAVLPPTYIFLSGCCDIVCLPVILDSRNGMSSGLTVSVLEGSKIPFLYSKNSEKKYRDLTRTIKGYCSSENRLKVDYTFQSASEAAKFLTGDPNADESVFLVAPGITLKDVTALHELDAADGIQFYHYESSLSQTFAAGYADGRKFVVKKGSIISPRLSSASTQSTKNAYSAAQLSGKIVNCVVTEDLVLGSPSQAAQVCCG